MRRRRASTTGPAVRARASALIDSSASISAARAAGYGEGSLLFCESVRQVLSRAHAELAVGGGQVLLDGLLAHAERVRDLPVRASVGASAATRRSLAVKASSPLSCGRRGRAPAISSSVRARSASGMAPQRIARSSAWRSGSRALTMRRRCRSATPRSVSARACSSRAGEADRTDGMVGDSRAIAGDASGGGNDQLIGGDGDDEHMDGDSVSLGGDATGGGNDRPGRRRRRRRLDRRLGVSL